MRQSCLIFLLILFLSSWSYAADTEFYVIPIRSESSFSQPDWININPSSASLEDGAYFSDAIYSGGITLPDSGVPSFAVGFTIPPNYKSGTQLILHMLWHISSGVANCTVCFRPNAMTIARAGRRPFSGSTAGLIIVGGETLTAPDTTYQVEETLVTIKSSEEGTDLEPNDAVIIAFFRSSASYDDTCLANMVIKGLYIIYETE